jgi:hypothetical protein
MSRAQLRPKLRLNKHDKEPPPSEGAMSGLANMKRKLAETDKEREKIINSQHKIKDDVSEITDSFTKMSCDMVNLRKDL